MSPTKKLTSKERRFVTAYLNEAAGNGSKAAVLAGYAKGSARITASRLLTKAHIQAALANVRDAMAREVATADAIVKTRVMSGEEALERLSLYARADIRKILDPNDPLAKLDDATALTIKTIRPGRYGRTVELHDAMRATELLAKAGGKLKEIVQVESLEQLIEQSMSARGAAA